MPPSPLRRKETGPDFRQDCDCCGAECGCADCERCRGSAVEVAQDWVPPPAMGAAGDAGSPPPAPKKAGKRGKR